MKAFIKIQIGNNTYITRRFTDGENPTVNLFGMQYTLRDIAYEGWHYEIHYYEDGYEPESAWRC